MKTLSFPCLCLLLSWMTAAFFTPTFGKGSQRIRADPALNLSVGNTTGLLAEGTSRSLISENFLVMSQSCQFLLLLLLLTVCLVQSLKRLGLPILLLSLAILGLDPVKAAASFNVTTTVYESLGLPAIAYSNDGGWITTTAYKPDTISGLRNVKYDLAGNQVWEFTHNCPDGSYHYASPRAITTTPDGAYLIAGTGQFDCAVADNDMYATKFNSDHTISWNMTLLAGEIPSYALTCSDGHHVIVGNSQSHGVFIRRLYANGGTYWNANPTSNYGYFHSAIELNDNRIAIVGQHNAPDNSEGRCLIYFSSLDGTQITWQDYAGFYVNKCSGIVQLSDGNLALTGKAANLVNTQYHAFIFTSDLAGTMGWSQIYEYPEGDVELVRVRQLYDGTLIVAGTKRVLLGIASFWLINVSLTDGTILKEFLYDFGQTQITLTNMEISPSRNVVGLIGNLGGIVYTVVKAFGCQAGAYFDSSTNTCKDCAAGHYQDLPGKESCKQCTEGYYQDLTGQAACKKCPVGKYQDTLGQIECKLCAIGKFQDTEGQNACQPCPVGEFQDQTGASSCTKCSTGSYQDQTGQTECTPCAIGYFQDLEGQASCQPCPLGTYEDATGSVGCTPCAIGHYQDATGQTSCEPCAAGYAQIETGKSSCTACAAGTHQPSEGQSQCIPCPTGKFQNETAKTSCYSCEPGYYQDIEGQESCNPCEAGKYQNEAGKISCIQCDIGQYQDSTGQDSCISCPAGTFQDAIGQTACVDCLAGSYQDALGQTSCKSCAVGQFQDVVGQSSCKLCPEGEYQDGTGATACKKCNTGQYQDLTGQTECKDCEIGYYQDLQGQATCQPCALGTYASAAGSLGCTSCDIGHYQDTTGQGSCKVCAVGYAQGETGKSSCTACATGTYQPNEGQSQCLECGIGTFQNETGKTSCHNCEPGTYQDIVAQASCKACEVGTYQNEFGKTSCVQCEIGKYQDSTGKDSCILCPAGTFQDATGQSSCVDCLAGTYQDLEGQTTCKQCEVGTAQLNTGQASCTPCVPGYYQDIVEQTTCKQCPLGQYQDLSGQIDCKVCPVGKYQNALGQSSCNSCDPGTYQDAEGQTSCKECAIGEFQDEYGATSCKICSKGYYQDATAQAQCKACLAGYYQDAEGQTSCQQCPIGTHASSTGSQSCTPCDPGSYQDIVGQAECKLCSAGYIQADTGKTSCSKCSVGMYQPNMGMTQCIECDPGTYQTAEGKTTCDACLAGYYQDLTGQTSCKLCQVGTYQSDTGKSSCVECEPGKYQDSEGHTSCLLCPLGTYQDISSQTSCKSCSVGHYQDVQGQASCKPCLAGYVQAMTGKDSCSACSIGTYQPNEGQSQCLECPPGSFQNETGKGSCYNCPPGSYQDLAGQTSCKLCQVGTYQSESGKASCVQCELGKYQDSEGQSSCILCPVGTYQDTLSQTSCKDCSIGHYQDVEGQSSCKLCAPGTFQSTVKQTSCEPCPAGYYQAESGKDQCVLCGVGTVQPDLGMSSCDDCEPGYFQDEEGKAVCKVCPAGTYQDISGQTSCKECPPGSNQPNTGATTCVTCNFGWYSPHPTGNCLYKGIFTTETEFASHPFSSACFTASTLVKPFSPSCRDAYRPMCCQGSTPLSTTNCNFALETAGTLLQNKYCSACTFMDRYACPTNGLCWDNTAWTSNDMNPYPAIYSLECLEAISPYCGEKFMADSADPECAPFLSNCFAEVKSSSYGSDWSKFRIEFTNRIPQVLPGCSELFDSVANPVFKTGSITCTRFSDTSIEVDVSGLSQPILNYRFADKVMKDACGIYLPSTSLENVAVPTPEAVFVDWNSTDKCMGLTIKAIIQKPYPWPIEEVYWEVTYKDPSGIPSDTINRLSFIGEGNKTTIKVPDYDLFPLKVLQARARIRTAYKEYVTSDFVEITVPTIASGKKYCGLCQLDDRTKCTQFNGVCWKDYLDYNVVEPFDTTDCLKAIASVCYSIWNASTYDDPQCLYFKNRFNFTAMKVKPSATSAIYSYTGKSIFLIFDYPIYRENFVDCSGVFDQATLKWLPPSRACSWKTPTSLEVVYDPRIGIMKEIGVKENAFFYDYTYSQEPVAPVKVPIRMPSLETDINIKGLTTVSECDTAELFGVIVTPTLYALVLKWDLFYNPPLPDSLKSEADKYFAPFKEYSQSFTLSIPSKFLKRGSTINVTLTAKGATVNSNTISTSKVINVVDNVANIKFTSKSQFVQEFDGSKSNNVPIQIYNTKCSGNVDQEIIPVDVSFSISSGISDKSITVHGPEESAIETNLADEYNKYKALFIGRKKGFKYLRYYNITATVKSKYTAQTNSDSLIVYFAKPPLKSVIDSPGSLVSIIKDVHLNGQNSVFPVVEGDVVEYVWKCMSTSSMEVGGKCDCPVLADFELRKAVLTLPKEKMANMCKYKFSLTVSATSGKYKRTAYNETEFITLAKPVDPLKGRIIKGAHNDAIKDIYFAFGMENYEAGDKASYKWILTEIESEDPRVDTKYSEKNTFIYNFFKNELKADIDPKIKNGDIPIPTKGRRRLEELQPQYLTPETSRILGINRANLLPLHKYTFGVTVYHNAVPSFLFLSFTAPLMPRPRNLVITPTTGTGFHTPFTLTFTLSSSTDVDEANYQIYRRDCPFDSTKPTPLTKPFSQSNTYTATLAPGLKSCNYQVEITLKVFEYDDSLEVKEVIVVNEPEEPIEEVLTAKLDQIKTNTDLTVDQKLTMLAGISSTEVQEPSALGKETAKGVFEQLETMDQPGGILEIMDDNDKLALIDTATAIIGDLVIKQKANVDVSLASAMSEKVDGFLTEVKTKEDGNYIIPTIVGTLSGIADIGTREQEGSKFFGIMQKTMDTMADMKVTKMVPGGVPYSISSPAIEMVVMKDYSAEYNNSKKLSTNKGSTITLPGGLEAQMVSKVKNTTGGPITFGAFVHSTTFNPLSTIKNNTEIDINSLTSGSTQGYKPETAQKIYTDLGKGMHKDLVNVKEQTTNLLQVSFKPFELQKDSSEKDLNSTISIGTLPEGEEAVFTLPVTGNFSEHINKSMMVPLYYNPENETWTNENCSLDSPGISDLFMNLRCKHVGVPSKNDLKQAFSVTVDVVKDVAKVIRAGNYEQLTDFSILASGSKRSIIAFLIIGFALLLVVYIEILLIRKDKTSIYELRIKYLNSRFNRNKGPAQNSLLNRVYSFFSGMKKKGLNNMSKKKRDEEKYKKVYAAESINRSAVKLKPTKKEKKKANGYTYLSVDDKQELKDLYYLYKQCSMTYEEAELESVISPDLERSRVLNRLTQDYVDDSLVNEPITYWSLMKNEHPILNSVAKAELETPRSVKFLICIAVLVGELFLSGYFYDTESDVNLSDNSSQFLTSAVVYSVAAALLMIPLKLIISLFLAGCTLSEDMTREQIEAAENRVPILRRIGLVLTYAWIIFCMYGILIYVLYFGESSINSWMFTFSFSVFIDTVVISQLEVVITIVIGVLLMYLAETELMMTAAGVLAAKVIDWLNKLF